MKTLRHISAAVMLLLCLSGCAEVELPQSAPQIVVEGWIEDGYNPIVMLITTVPIGESVTDLKELEKFVINWGKVTISDGENSVVLTGRRDDDYFPPYIYTTSSMTGQAGKTYTITVEYSGRTVTAQTTIPGDAPLEYIKVVASEENPDNFQLVGGLKDNRNSKDYYKFFVKVSGKDSTYVSSFLGLTDDAVLQDNTEIAELPINNGSRRSDQRMTTYFSAEDRVIVKFCTLDQTSWQYWNDFEEIQSLSRNPFFPVSTSIRSNVKGGLGYWAGYGSRYYVVSIADSLKAGRVF
jgi:hypothetical protein